MGFILLLYYVLKVLVIAFKNRAKNKYLGEKLVRAEVCKKHEIENIIFFYFIKFIW